MKWLLFIIPGLYSQFAISQKTETSSLRIDKIEVSKTLTNDSADKMELQEDTCLKMSPQGVVNSCKVLDTCFQVEKDSLIHNKCPIGNVEFKKHAINTELKLDSGCLAIKNSRFYNSCPIKDPCLGRIGATVVNNCVIDNKCLNVVKSKIVDVCKVADSCKGIEKTKVWFVTIKKKPINICTPEQKCLDDLKTNIFNGCNGCALYKDELELVYDDKTKKFFYLEPGKNPAPLPLRKLYNFRLYYNNPFRFEIINLNRYLYNVNLSNSDVTFTSTEALVMQQNLIAGATNGQITPANTYVNGSSGNQGDNIFNIIQAFKPNIDKLLGEINNASETIFSIKTAMQKIVDEVTNNQQLLNKIIKDQKNLTTAKKSTPAYRNLMDANSFNVTHLNTLNKAENSKDDLGPDVAMSYYLDTFLPALDSYLHDIQYIDDFFASFINTDSVESANFKNLLNLRESTGRLIDLYDLGVTNFTKDSATKKITYHDTVTGATEKLKEAFHNLEKYYNQFLDNKIIAYSVCTGKFNCCDADNYKNTYEHFDSLLTDISNAYLVYKSVITEVQPSDKKDATDPKNPPVKKNDSIFNVSTSDFIVENNRISGITLHQLEDAAKPKKDDPGDPKAASIKAIDSLWFSLEKSVSPDFIMRQILFNRNMVAENMKYVSPPITPKGDHMGLVFQIVASDSAKKNGVMLDNTTTESLDFMVWRKALFSFSAGSFIGTSGAFRTATYEFQQVPPPGGNVVGPNSPYKLVATGNGTAPIGIDGLANVTWRTPFASASFDSRWGVSGGVGAVIAPTIQIAYLAGVTFSIGTYQQFHFSGGYMGMNVNQLKTAYSTSSNIFYSTSPGSNIYDQKLKGGWFLSISYTIFTPKGTGVTQSTSGSIASK
jgi:hypothetical protein